MYNTQHSAWHTAGACEASLLLVTSISTIIIATITTITFTHTILIIT